MSLIYAFMGEKPGNTHDTAALVWLPRASASPTGHTSVWFRAVTVAFLVCSLANAAQAGKRVPMEKTLSARFHSAVEQALDTAGARIRISEIKSANGRLLDSTSRLHRFEMTRTRRPVGRVSARVAFSNGGAEMEAWVYAKVDAQVPVWVMSATVDRGAPIQGIVRVEMRDAARLPLDTLSADTSLMGNIAARRLVNGSPLTKRALTTPMLVRRGDQVKVLVRSGAVEIAASGTAMRDGRRGQHIPVRVRQGRVVQAAITGPRQLEIQR